MIHKSVLVKEILDLLNISPGNNVIDATLGEGGHTEILLESVGPKGKVLGIEQDAEIARNVEAHKNLTIAIGNFSRMYEIANKNNFENVNAILFDLGISSWHYKESGRGFSFGNSNEPLIMNLSQETNEFPVPDNGQTWRSAAEILNQAGEKELSDIFFNYGEERKGRLLAKKIVEARKRERIISVDDLLRITGAKDIKQKARIFQALRIAVNNELFALKEGIESAFKILVPGGRMAVISYHSLEDRIVKIFFNNKKRNEEAIILTKKPVTPAFQEIKLNSRSRSAKLRVLEKI